MGVNTNAILTKGTTITQIEKAISTKYTEVKVEAVTSDFMYITFKDGADQRQLTVSFINSCEKDDGIAGVWVSLGMWNNSIEIIKYLCETFGGYIDENDSDNEGFYSINYTFYSKGKEFTEFDEFKHKVIEKVGYNKLKTVMSLCKEYAKMLK